MTYASARPGRIAVLHDMSEEGWPSMDQMGHLLSTRVAAAAPHLSVTAIRHRLVPIVAPRPLRRVRPLFLADRLVNRMLLYPRRVRRQVRGGFDIYHLVDHSYAQLALDLPGAATIVTCHDVDAFRGLVQPEDARRSVPLRMLSARILRGLQRVRFVVCGSATARDDLVRFNLVDPARTRLVPNGIDPVLLHEASPSAQERVDRLVPRAIGVADVLHVGSDIPRKRLDRTIRIMAALRSRGHAVRLIRVGAPLRPATQKMAKELGFTNYVELPFLERDALRAVYQRAHLLLLTSDREGYGLPIIEAFAAGKPAVVSDIAAFRESAAGLATYVARDDLDGWVRAIERVLAVGNEPAALAGARQRHAASLTWDEHVRGLLPLYAEILESAAAKGTSRASAAAAAGLAS